MNKQQLASNIWKSANEMRSKIDPSEYKDYILGFLFYKFLSEKLESHYSYLFEGMPEEKINEYLKQKLTEENDDVVAALKEKLGYFIPYKNLFSTWIKMGKEFGVDNVRQALSSFDRNINPNYRNVFDNIFDTLQTGLSALGDSERSQSETIYKIINIIDKIPMSHNKYDVLGFIYEYLIGMFAANAGKKAGEFYTPHEVSVLMSEIIVHELHDKQKIQIYDPTSGSGSLLLNIGKAASKFIKNLDNITYYAQEIKQNTYSLTRMNLVMRNIKPMNIKVRNSDTLKTDWPAENGEHVLVDAVVSNPPYSQPWEPHEDRRWSGYGLAPKSKADYAFLLHDLYHLEQDGVMAIVLPHGVLFRGGEEGKIRKALVEKSNIHAIIGLPANIFFGTGIPTIVMVLKKKRNENDILFIDASKGFTKDGKNNKLRSSDIRRVVDAYKQRKNIAGFSSVVDFEKIKENDFNLNIPRYIESLDKNETYDIYSTMFGGIPENEMDRFKDIWNEFPSLKEDLFKKTENNYYNLKVDQEQLNYLINENNDVKEFVKVFKKSFNEFENFLSTELLDEKNQQNPAKLEEKIAESILNTAAKFNIIDKYDAYELFSEQWNQTILQDIEILADEGKDAARKVETKTKIDKDNKEVPDGKKGRILPFDIVQKYMLKDEFDYVTEKQQRLEEIDSIFSQTFEELSEDDKEDLKDIINLDKNQFVAKEVAKAVKKSDLSETNEDLFEKVKMINSLILEKKQVENDVKNKRKEIESKTEQIILNLTDKQIDDLLLNKWIDPLFESIFDLPTKLLDDFTINLTKLVEKYKDTYLDIENEIKEVSKQLAAMIDELEGDENDMAGLRQFKKMLEEE